MKVQKNKIINDNNDNNRVVSRNGLFNFIGCFVFLMVLSCLFSVVSGDNAHASRIFVDNANSGEQMSDDTENRQMPDTENRLIYDRDGINIPSCTSYEIERLEDKYSITIPYFLKDIYARRIDITSFEYVTNDHSENITLSSIMDCFSTSERFGRLGYESIDRLYGIQTSNQLGIIPENLLPFAVDQFGSYFYLDMTEQNRMRIFHARTISPFAAMHLQRAAFDSDYDYDFDFDSESDDVAGNNNEEQAEDDFDNSDDGLWDNSDEGEPGQQFVGFDNSDWVESDQPFVGFDNSDDGWWDNSAEGEPSQPFVGFDNSNWVEPDQPFVGYIEPSDSANDVYFTTFIRA
ncbi:MAG: hypothetical protein LBI63_02240 [Candidatus Ancillula sp.]|nr:hypothetical protein [Candidatus Ancillula sp.]